MGGEEGGAVPLYKFPTSTLASGNPQVPGERVHRSSGACPGPIWGARQRPKMNPIFPRSIRNQITYKFIQRSSQNLISSINNELENLGGKKRETKKKMLKNAAYPTMCMKTKENDSDRLTYPTMLMKTNRLIFVSYDVIEKMGS